MKLDLPTLAFVLSLSFFTQIIALFIQYRVNKTYRGIGYWLLGSTLLGLGFVFLSLGGIEVLRLFSLIANPMLVLGRISILIGVMHFIGKSYNIKIISVFFIVFAALYYYFLFADPNIVWRTVVVSSAIAGFSLAIAYALFFKGIGSALGSSRFTGGVFLGHACFLVLVIFHTLLSKPIHAYTDFSPVQVAAFIVPAITSTLWTFGFILMMNQRLSAENLEEKENLQLVFNAGPDAAMITRLEDGLVKDVNLGFSTLFGYAHAEAVGKRTSDLSAWNGGMDRQGFLQTLKEKGASVNVECVLHRKDGTRFVAMTSSRILQLNDEPHVITVTRDITDRKQAEEALRESEATYRSILDASPDDITITDLEGRVLLVSPAASRMFGYGEGEELGCRLLEFIIPEDRERARTNLQHMHQGGGPGPNVYRALRKDGSLFDIEVNSGFIRDVQGQPTKMVFVVRDISERVKAEAERGELEARNRQLLKAESLGRMAGAIAHHFNNQLQSVMANLDLINGFSSAIDAGVCLNQARLAAERAAEVSRLMLAYLGQTAGEQEPRSLAELWRISLPIIQGTLPKDVTLEAECPSPGPVIRANPNQLQQVLINLVTNAWEAMGEGGGQIRVCIRECLVSDIPVVHRFPINWQPQGLDYACLEISDTGGGIGEGDIETLFDPFFSTKFTGRGLGLSVVLGIVQAHGGAISVKSRLGQGSTFGVYFPVCAEELVVSPASRADDPLPERCGTILLVDDDEAVLASTGALLEMMGFALLTAQDGVEALEVFRQHRGAISCVITDLTMPRMDGWETLKALRQLEPDLPVILASGYDAGHVMSGAPQDRPQAFLGKPFGFQQLRDALKEAMASS